MADDFSVYEQLKADEVGFEEAAKRALDEGADTAFLIRMLRAVYALDFVDARNFVAELKYGIPFRPG